MLKKTKNKNNGGQAAYIVIVRVEQLTSHRVMFIEKRDLRGKGFMPIAADESEPR